MSATIAFPNEHSSAKTCSYKNILTDLNNIDEIKGQKRGETSEEIEHYVKNPFTGKEEVRFSKVLGKNKRTGESVISPLIVKDIERQNE